MKLFDSIETYAYGASKVLVSENEDKNGTKLLNLDDATKENIKEIIQIHYKFLIIHTEC